MDVFAGGFWGPYSTFIVISLGYGVVAGSLVSFVEPLAGGSGIPEIKTYLNGIHIKSVLLSNHMRKHEWFAQDLAGRTQREASEVSSAPRSNPRSLSRGEKTDM